jgi:phage host-nuclease inhibitor protein Gam
MKHCSQLKSPVVKTRAQMETLVREIAGLRLDEQTLLAGLERELQAARDRYETRLLALARLLADKTAEARAWAETNPNEFGRRRSIDFGHGTAGFRTGPPRLRPLTKRPWDRVLASLRRMRWGVGYIRVKEEINKERIIADIGAGKLAGNDLRRVGAEVVRGEIFYIESRRART